MAHVADGEIPVNSSEEQAKTVMTPVADGEIPVIEVDDNIADTEFQTASETLIAVNMLTEHSTDIPEITILHMIVEDIVSTDTARSELDNAIKSKIIVNTQADVLST